MKLAGAVTALLAVGCADIGPVQSPPELSGDQAAVSGGALFTSDETGSGDDFCGMLPCDGPCSLACDYDALVDQYVPDGTCVTFACELTDGTTIRLDACNPAEWALKATL